MEITTASTEAIETVTDLWIDLARDQRRHGSHLSGEANRAPIREAIGQRIVTDDLLVARREHGIVGFVMFTVDRGRYEQDVTTGLVENLYVRPEARREGVGSALLSAAERRLAEAGATVVDIEAMADNEAARQFYEAHGYTTRRVELEKRIENDTS